MSDSPAREWQFYIDDMLETARKVLLYTDDLDQAKFVSSGLNDDASVRNLEIMDEPESHVPEEVRRHHRHIPWRQIVATRNRLIHGDLGIDTDTLWSIVRDDIPLLAGSLAGLKAGLR